MAKKKAAKASGAAAGNAKSNGNGEGVQQLTKELWEAAVNLRGSI